ncbi:MAG TPA: hypothetical protein VJT08_16835 [Terriglobales bacterium]|nr:hypothetical protein [Terriglobales bacterium]
MQLSRHFVAQKDREMTPDEQIEVLRTTVENLARANSSLQEQHNSMSELLVHVLEVCNEHPTEARQLFSNGFVEQLKSLILPLIG